MSQCCDVAGWDQPTGLTGSDDVGDVAYLGRDRRKPDRHRLEQTERQPFVKRRQNEDVCVSEKRPRVVLFAHEFDNTF